MSNMSDPSEAFVYDYLYDLIAFRGSIATATIFVLMFVLIVARDALGLIRWGIPPRDGDDGNGRTTSAVCQITPDHSGH